MTNAVQPDKQLSSSETRKLKVEKETTIKGMTKCTRQQTGDSPGFLCLFGRGMQFDSMQHPYGSLQHSVSTDQALLRFIEVFGLHESIASESECIRGNRAQHAFCITHSRLIVFYFPIFRSLFISPWDINIDVGMSHAYGTRYQAF